MSNKKEEYNIEILVDKESKKDSVEIVENELDIEINKNTARVFSGITKFNVDLKREKLKDSFYKSIKKSNNLALLKDDSSLERIKKVIDNVEEVEILLKKLLTYVKDSVEEFFEIINKISTHADGDCVISTDSIDPITSDLSLGTIKQILKWDMSWSNDHHLELSELVELLSNSDNLSDLESNIRNKMKSKTIWDIISSNILEKEVSLNYVIGQIDNFKKNKG